MGSSTNSNVEGSRGRTWAQRVAGGPIRIAECAIPESGSIYNAMNAGDEDMSSIGDFAEDTPPKDESYEADESTLTSEGSPTRRRKRRLLDDENTGLDERLKKIVEEGRAERRAETTALMKDMQANLMEQMAQQMAQQMQTMMQQLAAGTIAANLPGAV